MQVRSAWSFPCINVIAFGPVTLKVHMGRNWMRLLKAGASARVPAITAVLVALASSAFAQPAPSMTGRDVQVVARALGFLQPPPSGDAWVAVVFSSDSTASRHDAERIAALFGDGVRIGSAMLRARPVGADAMARAGGPSALIAAAGAPMDIVMAAARSGRVACITAAREQVEAGQCTIWVRSEPRVEIVVNQAAARSCGLDFAAAFRMMVREI